MTAFDYASAYELELHASNLSYINNVGRTLTKFWLKDNFSYDRALGYVYRNLILPAAKDYKLCHGSMTQSWQTMFPLPERKQASEAILNNFISEFKLGNFWE